MAPDGTLMVFQDYLRNIPLLHTWDLGRTWSTGGFKNDQLSIIVDLIRKNFSAPRIIETGAGNSTISFLFCGPSEVVSICPEQAVFDRIMNYCSTQSVSTERLRSIVGCSEWELPRLAEKMRMSNQHFDFALIDGSHNWPIVFVDFCYINAMTRRGSFIMVDDIQLHSARELANLLLEQPGFFLERDLGKALIFRKTTSTTSMPEWVDQPYIARRSMPPVLTRSREFIIRKTRPIIEKMPFGPLVIRVVKSMIKS